MKKNNLKSLELKKITISRANLDVVKGGSIGPTFLCPSKIYNGEDNCVSIINQN